MNFNSLHFIILKRARVFFATCFLILCSLAFFNFPHTFLERSGRLAVGLQFVPSLLKTIALPVFIGVGLVTTLLLTFLFGRIYCSVICPLGVLQDFISWTSRKLKFKTKFKFKKNNPFTRYSILALTILFAFLGVITLLTLLDPFSIYGRISGYLLKPVAVLINNTGADGLAKAGVYSLLSRGEFLSISFYVLIVNLVSLIIICWLSFTSGRLYCNTICPVGTLLGLISKFSLFKIKLDKGSCTKCGKCAAVCKSSCIDLKTLAIDHSRCVACFNCLAICPEEATKFQLWKNMEVAFTSKKQVAKVEKNPPLIDSSKRNFLLGSMAVSASLLLLSKPFRSFARVTGEKGISDTESEANPVSPPGSVAVNHLNDVCTGCSICISACPTKVLRPSFLGYGITGMMQPYLDFEKNFCEYDCIVCGKVCPTGAIKPLTVESKHFCQVGIAKFDLKKCIVETDGEKCSRCADHCPAGAIQMVPHGDLFVPEVMANACTGCGECQFVCPARPSRAIHVLANAIHQLAVKPKQVPHDDKSNEFPF